MGWVVYEESTGQAHKYYKKESVAKRICTQHNQPRDPRDNTRGYYCQETWIYCSYADYEGVLMGMQEPERRVWAFCRG